MNDAGIGLERHDLHYFFCHRLLPALAFDSETGLSDVFLAALFEKHGTQALSNLWNFPCDGSPELRTTADDFEREIRVLSNGWVAVVITPPPAMEGTEAHQIGVLVNRDASPPAESAQLRYLCLEQHLTFPSMTMIGEWLAPGERQNLGFGPDPSPEAMFELLAALVGATQPTPFEIVPELHFDQEGETPQELLDLEDELAEAITDGRSLDEFECRSILAQALLDRSQPNKATVHCEALVELLTRIEGPDSKRTMTWRGFLGRSLTESRRYVEAAEVLSDLLMDRNRLLGPEHRQTLTTRGNLARAVAFGGRISEGILAVKQLLADRTRLFGELDPSTLDTLGHLARFHYLAGDLETAVSITEEQLGKRREALNPDDPVIAQTIYNLDVYRTAASESEDGSARLRRKAANIADDLGADHPTTLLARGEYADQLLFSGDADTAITVLHELLSDRTRVLGATEPGTVATSTQYGVALRLAGHAARSVDHLKGLIAAMPADAPSPSPQQLEIRAELAQSLAAAGRLQDAVSELRLLGMDMAHLEPAHPLRRWVEDEIANLP